jgi:hypothetical protein
MLKTIKTHYCRFSKAPFFSPQGFLVRGMETGLILHLVGCKQYVGSLFGTTSAVGAAPVVYLLRLTGITYGFFYFFFFLMLSPIFIIASVFFWIFLYADRRFNKAPKM